MSKKMIVKGCAWNRESKRHMKVLDWAMSQNPNFSNYLRELVVLDYERCHNQTKTYSSKPILEDEDADFMKKLI